MNLSRLLLPLLLLAEVACGKGFVPLSQCDVARITYFSYANGACGFGDLTGETGPGYVFGAAPNEALYDGALHCGECVELVGPEGALRLMIVDLCPANAENPLCHGDMAHLDLTEPAFPHLMEKSLGGGNVSWRFVECDVAGPIKFKLTPDSSETWHSMLVWNHRLGLRAAEYSQDGGSTWTPIARKPFNLWAWTPPSGQGTFSYPMQLRFLSSAGEHVQAVINGIDEKGKVLLAQAQFLGASEASSNGDFEECCSPPDGFTDVYHDGNLLGVWNDWSYSATIALDYSGITPHSGSSCIRASLQGWGGLQIGSGIAAPRSQYSAVSLWIRTDAACSDCFVLTVGSDGTDVQFGTSTGGTWEHVQVSLEDLGVPETAVDAIKTITVMNNAESARTCFVDDITLVKAASAPSLALCADDGNTDQPSGNNDDDGSSVNLAEKAFAVHWTQLVLPSLAFMAQVIQC